jgi:hypothetical protein
MRPRHISRAFGDRRAPPGSFTAAPCRSSLYRSAHRPLSSLFSLAVQNDVAAAFHRRERPPSAIHPPNPFIPALIYRPHRRRGQCVDAASTRALLVADEHQDAALRGPQQPSRCGRGRSRACLLARATTTVIKASSPLLGKGL